MIRLVTFDLDGTLWNLDGVIERAIGAMNRWLASRAPAYAAVPREEADALHRAVLQAQPALAHDMSALRLAVLRSALEHAGEPPDRAASLAEGAFAEFLDWRHRVTLFPDALPVLGELRERHTLAALTNGNADYQRLGLDRYFAFGYSAADVGARKPHPAMFRQALAHASVPAAEAVHVGDHPVDDVQGAADVGMGTVWVDLGGAREPAVADAVVTALAALPAALRALDAGGGRLRHGLKATGATRCDNLLR